MPVRLGPLELTIILLIVILLFGPGRLGRVAGELGKGIKSFREGLKDDTEETPAQPAEQIEAVKKEEAPPPPEAKP